MFQEENFLKASYPVRGLTVSLVLAGIVYATLKYLFLQIGLLFVGLGELPLSLEVVLIFITVVIFSVDIHRREKTVRKAFLQFLRGMPYMDFRLLIIEALRREGYSVEEREGFDADHGIDLILIKGDHRIAALCKHWERREIDSFQVQELYESMIREGADVSLFITTGDFTEEARRMARSKSVILADGMALLELVKPVHADSEFESICYLRRASLEPTYY